MKRTKLLTIFALLFITATSTWATTIVTWNEDQMERDFVFGVINFTIDGVTLTSDNGLFGGNPNEEQGIQIDGSFTFSTTSGKNFTKIQIFIGSFFTGIIQANNNTWTWNESDYCLEWKGDATNVNLKIEGGFYLSKIIFTLKDGSPVEVTAKTDGKGNYWATFYDSSESYTADTNTTIYQAAVSGDRVALTEVAGSTIPSNNAVILISSSSAITLTPTTTTPTTLTGNELLGADAATTNPGNAYCLTNGASGIGFYKFTDGGTIPAHHAYLANIAGSRGFIGLDGTSCIEAIEFISDDVPLYDLSGRQVTSHSQKGIYVKKNGKKIIIK